MGPQGKRAELRGRRDYGLPDKLRASLCGGSAGRGDSETRAGLKLLLYLEFKGRNIKRTGVP